MSKDTEKALAENTDIPGRENALSADIICGGFPCQDISNAGKRAGISGERSGLWKHLCEAIRVVRPKYAILENVAALLNRGLSTVLGDMAEVGYDTEWNCIPASYVGAEHERDRVWIIAYPDGQRELQQERSERESRQRPGNSFKENASNFNQTRHKRGVQAGKDVENVGKITERLRSSLYAENTPSREHWNHKPVLGRGIHGVPNRLDRIGALGNAVVPQIPELIGRAIMSIENKEAIMQHQIFKTKRTGRFGPYTLGPEYMLEAERRGKMIEKAAGESKAANKQMRIKWK